MGILSLIFSLDPKEQTASRKSLKKGKEQKKGQQKEYEKTVGKDIVLPLIRVKDEEGNSLKKCHDVISLGLRCSPEAARAHKIC
ncbi:hypothetical protein TNIN_156921 [Trichonephila inaurata madagascariensis]|uniref:Uncharacterized protein n=1 Tax=Trichonephila inaurata madagascariensis TaxID=2747483 RepID=A0A8X6JNS5_9ARAC|nr:hypothetical protein TNIN_156921 [Trichonephila inaurata madagascariensis]